MSVYKFSKHCPWYNKPRDCRIPMETKKRHANTTKNIKLPKQNKVNRQHKQIQKITNKPPYITSGRK